MKIRDLHLFNDLYWLSLSLHRKSGRGWRGLEFLGRYYLSWNREILSLSNLFLTIAYVYNVTSLPHPLFTWQSRSRWNRETLFPSNFHVMRWLHHRRETVNGIKSLFLIVSSVTEERVMKLVKKRDPPISTDDELSLQPNTEESYFTLLGNWTVCMCIPQWCEWLWQVVVGSTRNSNNLACRFLSRQVIDLDGNSGERGENIGIQSEEQGKVGEGHPNHHQWEETKGEEKIRCLMCNKTTQEKTIRDSDHSPLWESCVG